MILTRHLTPDGPRWALEGHFLLARFDLSLLLSLPSQAMLQSLEFICGDEQASGDILAPIDPDQEVWAAGVTYLRSRQARQAESSAADVYQRVYDAPRPELFFKSPGWRVCGPSQPVRIRKDSRWNVPEPEMTLVINSRLEIVGYCAGNDMSSRDIEGENPLYLPQAKIYAGSCALGPGIQLAGPGDLTDLPIQLEVMRAGIVQFSGQARTSMMKRTPTELVAYLGQELPFPHGAFLMTGTGIVPGEDFSLRSGDIVRIRVGELALENPVSEAGCGALAGQM